MYNDTMWQYSFRQPSCDKINSVDELMYFVDMQNEKWDIDSKQIFFHQSKLGHLLQCKLLIDIAPMHILQNKLQ